MKMNQILPCSFLIACGFLSSALGQTSNVKINIVSASAGLTVCKTRLRTSVVNGQPVTVFGVLVPKSLELDFDASTVSFRSEGDYFLFQFEADSGSCKITSSGYEISLSRAGSNGAGSGLSDPAITDSVPHSPASPPVIPQIAPGLIPTEAEAQEAVEDAGEVDFSIPESPGFTVLGLTPQDVTRPSTPREFATAVINSIDRNGNLQSGIAVDMAPYQILFGDRITRDQYIPADSKSREPLRGYLTRLLWRTQFSLATTKGTTDDDKSARIGAGLNFTFLDFGDPDTDFKLRACNDDLNGALDNQSYLDLGLSGPGDQNLTPELRQRQIERKRFLIVQGGFLKKYEKCAEDSEKRNFGRSSFGVGLAGSWISKTGDSSKFTNNGQGLWASLAYGFEGIPGLRCSEDEIVDETNRCITPQLILHFRRRVKESVPDPLVTGGFTTKDSNLFGARLRLGVPKWALNFEGVYRAERFAGRTSSSNIQASIGADYRLANNLYLNFAVGGETKESNIPGAGKAFIRTSFNWGAAQRPQ